MFGCTIDLNKLILILILISIIIYFYLKYKLSYWSKRGVKCPPTNLIFGNFKDTITFKKPPGILLQDIYNYADKDDKYIGFYILSKPALLLRDIDLIKQIMVSEFNTFPNRMFGGKYEKDTVGLCNLLGINQPKWKYLRNKMTPSFTGGKMKTMVPLMLECCNSMLAYIDDKPANADGWKDLELKALSSRYATDVISSVAFGINTNSFHENDVAFWEAGQKILSGTKRGIIVLIYFLLPEITPLIEPLAKKPAEFFRHVFWDSMNAREISGNKRGDLVDSLLALKNGEQNPEFNFKGDNLLAQAVSFFVAGFEASSTAIAFVIYELALHPEYEQRLYDEIKGIVDKDGITMDSIKEMSFLDDVLEESLRLYPPLPIVDRIAVKDYKLPGTDLIIEKGTPIYVSINGVNRDSRYFSDPTTFNPLREKGENNKLSGSLAFGIGPRSCIGQRLGILITKIAVIQLVLNFKIFIKQEREKLLNPITIFTNAADGVYVQFQKRINNVN
ncbi:PREDICTED: cytochrome P450 6k1-like [Polistes dominula]|uniref:Cytochrome P450 6k1-like n=1 Tax=Polistes dominula TaxID=743375 RepID=A0ABM1J3F8_POLDO|nr:PREDICTED: cytochrome P450 6k1-like [Polistes dominula]